MKRIITSQILIFIALFSWGQISINTEKVAFGANLNEINAQAQLDFGKFKVDIAGGYNIDEKKIEYMKVELSMDAAEIYLACEIGRVADKNIDEVLSIYKANKRKGWGYIAKQMGIKPGSEEFHALKECTDSYYSVKPGKGKGEGKSKKSGKK